MPSHLVLAQVLASWTLGWEALVAIGTLLLALVTFLLVRGTADLARSSEADIQAQWRPVILPASYDPDGSALTGVWGLG
jgi:positive regulator of sigma E activity